MSTTAKIPITNTISGGDYTAAIELGPDKNPANVILDTGSSTLAVWRNKFANTPTTPTNYVQFVGYGTGSWAGPVMKAQVGMGTGTSYIDLTETTIAQIQSGEYGGHPQFYPADGILGLAYAKLNQAADVGPDYPISRYDTQQEWEALSSKYQNIDPWFKDLVDTKGVPNKFAFLTKRSFVDWSSHDPASDPANQGWFILGGGEEHTELYSGDFQSAAVAADEYYNTKFLELQVGTQPAIQVPILEDLQRYYRGDLVSALGSNSIIDSGTNSIRLFSYVYQKMLQSFGEIDSSFSTQIQAAGSTGVRLSASDLASWPSIFVTLEGADGANLRLEMKPETYWQINATRGQWSIFNISSTNLPQSILGLPLMNNYYVVFDRSAANGQGEVKFAAQSS